MIAIASPEPSDFPVQDPIMGRIVGRTVRRRVRRGEVAAQDARDLEQTLLLQLMRSWHTFDAERSHMYSYATTVAERTATNVLRDRRAEKRNPGGRRQSSIQSLLIAGDEPDTDLRLDIATILDTLPDELRWLAEQLMTASVSQVAREYQIPRSTLYRQLHSLRVRFSSLVNQK